MEDPSGFYVQSYSKHWAAYSKFIFVDLNNLHLYLILEKPYKTLCSLAMHPKLIRFSNYALLALLIYMPVFGF